MEIFGGFMVMISILGFFLAIIWLIMPFVVFAIKGKLDQAITMLAESDKRLASIENRLAALQRQSAVHLPAAQQKADSSRPDDQANLLST